MGGTALGVRLQRRRREAGLSQRALAKLAGVPQPNIAAYERGRRKPSAETARRLDAALDAPTLERVRRARDVILESAARRRLKNVRVFGSVARRDATAASDLDLLVEPAPGASIFDLAGFKVEVEEALRVKVDVLSDRGTGPAMARIRAEAVAL